jgi:hypothetical protein
MINVRSKKGWKTEDRRRKTEENGKVSKRLKVRCKKRCRMNQEVGGKM